MDDIIVNLADVTLATTVIALISIFVVGCFKLIPGLKNMENKQGRKAIYQALSLVISAGLATGYHFLIAHGVLDWGLVSFILVVVAEVNVIYPLYENLGLRALLKKIICLIIPSKAKEVNELVDTVANSLGKEKDNQEESLPTSEEVKARQDESEKTGWLQ